jgi:hypothetical protein
VEILLLGLANGYADLNGQDQDALLANLEKTVIAEAKFFREFDVRARRPVWGARMTVTPRRDARPCNCDQIARRLLPSANHRDHNTA